MITEEVSNNSNPHVNRRRYYKLTAAGQKVLAEQRRTWKDFFAALDRVAGISHA